MTEQDKVLALLQALLNFPLLVLRSLAGAATKKLRANKYEAIMGVSILVISALIMHMELV